MCLDSIHISLFKPPVTLEIGRIVPFHRGKDGGPKKAMARC